MLNPWGDSRRFYTYNRYLERTFGKRLQKIPIDAGFSCPNRDGTSGTGGCSYCLNAAFNPSYCISTKSITEQLSDGLLFFAKMRSQADGCLAYFQAFSNTHGQLQSLAHKYEEALAHPNVRGIVIATRPDCIDSEKLDLLAALQQRTYVALEIGIESIHDGTLRRINRGHDVQCTLTALESIAPYGIPVCGHLIFGLPGETPDTWFQDLRTINTLPLNSVKFHQLQIIKGTQMERDFQEHRADFHTFTFDTYVAFVADYLTLLRPDIAVERLAGEVPPRFIGQPIWQGKRYYELVAAVETELKRKNKCQGADF